jgi:hypothetical protein
VAHRIASVTRGPAAGHEQARIPLRGKLRFRRRWESETAHVLRISRRRPRAA